MSDDGGPSPSIAVESPLQDDIRILVAELNATARDNGAAAACGALKRHDGGIGEVKRMYTRPLHRGRKVGAMIVEGIEALARAEGLKRLVLETGDRYPAAWTVYERAGFIRCGPVLDYPESKWSVFYEKSLAD